MSAFILVVDLERIRKGKVNTEYGKTERKREKMEGKGGRNENREEKREKKRKNLCGRGEDVIRNKTNPN